MAIRPDKGKSFVDQNGYRLPKHALLPLFRAVDAVEAHFAREPLDWSAVDVITDRNNLRKLIDWVGPATRKFRIDVQLAGTRTLLFQRWEERNLVYADGNSFGYSFERATTRIAAGCKETTGHHRVVSYVRHYTALTLRKSALTWHAHEGSCWAEGRSAL